MAQPGALQAIVYAKDSLRLLDQRLLPFKQEYLDCPDTKAAWTQIRDMVGAAGPAQPRATRAKGSGGGSRRLARAAPHELHQHACKALGWTAGWARQASGGQSRSRFPLRASDKPSLFMAASFTLRAAVMPP